MTHQQNSKSVLSKREWEVAKLRVTGLTAKEIAVKLNIAKPTVASHLASIHRILGIKKVILLPAALKQLDKTGIIGTTSATDRDRIRHAERQVIEAAKDWMHGSGFRFEDKLIEAIAVLENLEKACSLSSSSTLQPHAN